MKLTQVLTALNQIEKSKFITCLDKLCSSAESCNIDLSERLSKMNKHIKDASGSEITILFNAVEPHYKAHITEQLALAGPSITLLLNILTRDGNGVARASWVEQLYSREWESMNTLSLEISAAIENAAEDDSFSREHRLRIFKDCLEVAYTNDLKSNREARISDDERSVLNKLAAHLKIPQEEVIAIEHIFSPVRADKNAVEEGLQMLRELGIVFINRKRLEVLIPDEIVNILNDLQGKRLLDKHVVRILRTMTDGELANILKKYGKRVRNVSRPKRIHVIVHAGIPVENLLLEDIFNTEDGLNKRKERLKQLIQDLDITTDRLGTTVEERFSIIIDSLKNASEREFLTLSVSGYNDLLEALESNFEGSSTISGDENFTQRIRREFELEDVEDLNTDRLRALGVTPHDLLYLLSNEEVKHVRDKMGLSKRGNPRLLIIDAFASANDKLIDNYAALARRDLAALKEAGVDISEADIGSKFEEVTKTIFEELDLSIDEELRKSINTAKDKADIIISISEDDVIIGEAKTCKNGDFAKYSTTSRQVKAYANRCENQGRRVAQVLIIAPSFSRDFVESAEMDTEVNISLLTAEGLKLIHDAYGAKRNPNFSAKLFTKGGLLKAELIAKNI
ncbi:MAG: hypothetical protein JJU03_09005 [Idiomarina sp.]|nr:hypothetical protein [Idiomarina sp.]